MKKILLVNFLAIGVFSFAQTYCTPVFDDGCDGGDMIDSFIIPSAGFTHQGTGCSTGSYGDYTSMTINMNAGLNYDFSVTHQFDDQNVRIWIDFNNDGNFDDVAPELVASGTSQNVGGEDVTMGVITIPATVTPGTYRMRVADRYSSDPIPCNDTGYGEAHDYTVVIGAAPSCLAPSGVTVSSPTANSAQLEWTAPPSAPGSGYEYYYSATNTAPTATTVASGSSTGLSANLTSLSAATVYNVWVRSVCSTTDKSAWSTKATFTTACGILNVPYVQDFEAVSVPDLPLCTVVVNDGTGNEWHTDDYDSNGFTGKTLRYSYSFSNPADTWFFTPAINLTAGVSYRIKYKYANSEGTTVYPEKLKVAYGTSATSADMTNSLADHPDISISTATTNSVDFTPATTGVYYFGFNAYSDTNMNQLYVDDIKIDVTPTCNEPTLLSSSNITATGASVSWTAPTPAPAGGYEIYYSTTNTAPTATSTPNFTGITATTYSIPSLTPYTPYYVWVRSVCSVSDKSAWSDRMTFTTLCSSINLPYIVDFENVTAPTLPGCTESVNAGSGQDWESSYEPFDIQGFTGNVLRYRYDLNNPADAWFFTQGLNLTAGQQYTISYKYGNSSTTYVEKMKVTFGTSRDVSAMTNLIMDYPSINDNTMHDESLTFTVPATGVYYIGFNAYSDANQDKLYLDDINITAANLATSEVDRNKNKLAVYPNPFTDTVHISDSNNVKNALITDAAGRLIKSVPNPGSTMYVSDLKQGLYLITLEMKDGSKQTIKALKK